MTAHSPDIQRVPLGRSKRLGIASAAAALCAGVFAGCGSSSHPEAAAANASAPKSAPSSLRSQSTADKSVPVTSSPAAPGPGAGACRAISVNLNFLTAVTGSSEDPSLDEHVNQLSRLVGTAPAEIKGDLQVVLQFDQRSLSAIRAGRSPDSIQETPELTAALTHVARWISANCTH